MTSCHGSPSSPARAYHTRWIETLALVFLTVKLRPEGIPAVAIPATRRLAATPTLINLNIAVTPLTRIAPPDESDDVKPNISSRFWRAESYAYGAISCLQDAGLWPTL